MVEAALAASVAIWYTVLLVRTSLVNLDEINYEYMRFYNFYYGREFIVSDILFSVSISDIILPTCVHLYSFPF